MFKRKEKKCVLLVDNFDQAREITKVYLEASDYKVIAVSNATDAMAQLEKKIPDLIMSEIELPGTGSIAFYNSLKKQKITRSIPFVFYARSENQRLEEGIKKFHDIYISKQKKWKETNSILQSFLAEREQLKIQMEQQEKQAQQAKVQQGKQAQQAKQTQQAKQAQQAKKNVAVNAQQAQQAVPKVNPTPVIQKEEEKVEFKELVLHSPLPSTKKRKKRRAFLEPLTQGHNTDNFMMAESLFDKKNLSDIYINNYNSKKTNEPLKFDPLVIPNTGLREKMRLEIEAELADDNNFILDTDDDDSILMSECTQKDVDVDNIDDIFDSLDHHIEDIRPRIRTEQTEAEVQAEAKAEAEKQETIETEEQETETENKEETQEQAKAEETENKEEKETETTETEAEETEAEETENKETEAEEEKETETTEEQAEAKAEDENKEAEETQEATETEEKAEETEAEAKAEEENKETAEQAKEEETQEENKETAEQAKEEETQEENKETAEEAKAEEIQEEAKETEENEEIETTEEQAEAKAEEENKEIETTEEQAEAKAEEENKEETETAETETQAQEEKEAQTDNKEEKVEVQEEESEEENKESLSTEHIQEEIETSENRQVVIEAGNKAQNESIQCTITPVSNIETHSIDNKEEVSNTEEQDLEKNVENEKNPKVIYLSKNNNQWIQELDHSFTAEEFEDWEYSAFSMASLCFQMFDMHYQIKQITVDTQENQIILSKNEDKEIYCASILPKKMD